MTSRLEVIRLQGLVNLGGELELTQYCDVFAGVTQSDVSLGVAREGGITTAGSAQFVSLDERDSVWVQLYWSEPSA